MDYAWEEEKYCEQDIEPELAANSDFEKHRQRGNEKGDDDADDFHDHRPRIFVVLIRTV